jgi:tetratricopeptide (TPR) repeat protein
MAKKKQSRVSRVNHEELPLPELCKLVMDLAVPFEDVAEFIENRTYALCVDGKCKDAISELNRVASFFETMESKNEENCRDLADIYIMIGEVNQYVGCFKDSIEWFKKAAVVFDRYAVPYHNLATSYIELGDIKNAVKSLEQEISLEPGNYFSSLKLADLYEQQGENKKEEECLENLLARNPENIQALHKLITHYELQQPHVDVNLLRKRLIAIGKVFSELEMVIRVYHLCRLQSFSDALEFLAAKVKDNPAMTILHLLKAFVFGELRQYSKKRKELVEFKQLCLGRIEYMKSKLDEFEHIFGKKAVMRLGRILMVTNPNINK